MKHKVGDILLNSNRDMMVMYCGDDRFLWTHDRHQGLSKLAPNHFDTFTKVGNIANGLVAFSNQVIKEFSDG